jgi:hypothetical protein
MPTSAPAKLLRDNLDENGATNRQPRSRFSLHIKAVRVIGTPGQEISSHDVTRLSATTRRGRMQLGVIICNASSAFVDDGKTE